MCPWKLETEKTGAVNYTVENTLYLVYRKRQSVLTVMKNNVEAYAQNKKRKVEIFCSQFSQWPFHVPNSKTSTR